MSPPLRSLLSVLFFVGLFGAEPLRAQGTLRSAVMEVDLPSEPGPVPVRLTLELMAGASEGGVPFTILTPQNTKIDGLRLVLPEALPMPLPIPEESRPHYAQGMVQSFPVGTLAYSVREAWRGQEEVILPIPAPSWTPSASDPRTFTARIAVPTGWTVLESFPTSVTRRPPPGEGGIYEISLQGIPSILVLRLTRGGAPLLTLERMLDLLVVGILLLMGVWGIRYLKGIPA